MGGNAERNGGPVDMIGRLTARARVRVQIGADLLAWALGLAFAMEVRYDLTLRRVWHLGLLGVIAAGWALQLTIGTFGGLYRRRWRFGSFEEVASLVKTTLTVSVLVFAGDLLTGRIHWVPASVPLAGGLGALMLMMGSRYLWRLQMEQRLRPSGERAERVLVFGAGEGAVQVMRAMLHDPDSPYVPVALLDDNPGKRRLSIMRVPVVGDRTAMASAAKKHRASTLLIAIPSADATLVRELSSLGREAGLEAKVLPPVVELLDTVVDLLDIRSPTMADLLGRREIDTDVASIASYLSGKRVLVTGAGGSIGAELCRQIDGYRPSALYMLDRDESALHSVYLSLRGRATMEEPQILLGDIRDATGLFAMLARTRPEVVFHAAALKHQPLLEAFPAEAVKTNVWGTRNVLAAARSVGVERFVNISTDKAADPVSVLGYSKRIGECLTSWMAHETGDAYVSVRFGNVLGSRGSVLTTFRSQIATGGPVTVTHPEVTRFFMTVEEAVQLVIQAGMLGEPGEALVLDMGSPVCIAEVAERLIAEAGVPVQIEYTGLRAGEKLHEVLLGPGEHDLRPHHPLVAQVPVPPLDADHVFDIDPASPPAQLIGHLAYLAGAATRIADPA